MKRHLGKYIWIQPLFKI